MVCCTRRLECLLWGLGVTVLMGVTACRTLQVAVDGSASPGTPRFETAPTVRAAPTLVVRPTPLASDQQGIPRKVVAWYGEIHSVSGADPYYDYLKQWHLNIWDKFGRAVGIVGDNPFKSSCVICRIQGWCCAFGVNCAVVSSQ